MQGNALYDFYRSFSRINVGQPKVPRPRKSNTSFDAFRTKLPIYMHKEDILNALGQGRMLHVGGDPGIGKSTQICQFILDYYQMIGQKCQILVSMATDLQARSTAYRVAREREEPVGQTVGYQLAHASAFGPATLLTFCSYERMLKTLMHLNDSVLFNSLTHLIVDELQTRDYLTDFLFMLVKEILLKYRHIKFVFIGKDWKICFIFFADLI